MNKYLPSMYSKSIQCSERSCNRYAYLQRFWKKDLGLHETVLFFYWSFTTNNHCTLPRSMIHCINQQRVSTRDCTRHDGRNLGASHVIHRELRLHCQHCKKSQLYGYIMLELLLQTYIIVLCSIVLLFMIRIAFLLPADFETAGPLPQEFQSSSGVRILTLALWNISRHPYRIVMQLIMNDIE